MPPFLQGQSQVLGSPRTLVKFVDLYGVEPHRLLTKEHLAPEFFYRGRIGCLEGDSSYGHLRMVVMEYIEGKTSDQVKQLPPTFLHDIRHALEILHTEHYLFGDLQGANIMITKDKKLRLIDFDWAGKDMRSEYPLLMSSNINWPEGVEALSMMKIDHDNEMLATLFQDLNEKLSRT